MQILVVVHEAGGDILHLCDSISEANNVIKDNIDGFWDLDEADDDEELNNVFTVYTIGSVCTLYEGSILLPSATGRTNLCHP